MSKLIPTRRFLLRSLTTACGVVLLAMLVWRAGPSKLVEDVARLGWGIALVLALGGIPHVLKAWAWRFTLLKEARKTTFAQLLQLRLASEAIGNFGALGQIFGESIRVSALNSEIPVSSRISSVTLDRGLFIVTGASVSLLGILAALLDRSLSRVFRSYAELFVLLLLALLLGAGLTIRRRWPVLSHCTRLLAKVRCLARHIESKRALVESVEERLLGFYSSDRKSFWASLGLNFLCQAMTTVEIYVILLLMGTNIGLLSAFIFDALMKLVNVVGTVNPGNVGTYEAGTVLIAGMFRIGGAMGLAVAVTRRLRTLFWSAIGAGCLIALSRTKKKDQERRVMMSTQNEDNTVSIERPGMPCSCADPSSTALILVLQRGPSQFRVGALPIALRLILTLEQAGVSRIVMCVDPATGPELRRELIRTKRLPTFVEWYEVRNGRSLPELVRSLVDERPQDNIFVATGDTTYHPGMVRDLIEWDGEGGALTVKSSDQLIGICALTPIVAKRIAGNPHAAFDTVDQLHDLLATTHSYENRSVSAESWQRVRGPEEQRIAEKKLNSWLVKPTDGIFAQMNRKVSIPISRQLIRWPITPNMVSIFTLGVGLVSGIFFALSGYWNVLLGALLSVWASILDGCDGEVARLKLQESAFGCWLETICDYLYYLFIFSGMAIGLVRTYGTTYLFWTGVLIFGAITSFLVTGMGRHRLACAHPEQYLRIWQAHTESRQSNPILYIGRHCEFMVRRCFMPYALLFFALIGMTKVVFVLAAVGANLVWFISLYSYRSFAAATASSERLCDATRKIA